jgi:hypothetical protein
MQINTRLVKNLWLVVHFIGLLLFVVGALAIIQIEGLRMTGYILADIGILVVSIFAYYQSRQYA